MFELFSCKTLIQKEEMHCLCGLGENTSPPGRCSLVWFLFNTYCIFPSMHLGSGNFKRVIYNFSITLDKNERQGPE